MKSKQLCQQEKEGKFLTLNLANQGLNQDIDRAEQRAHRYCPEYDDEHTMWIELNELELEKSVMKSIFMIKLFLKLQKTSICHNILIKYVVIDNDGPPANRAKMDLLGLQTFILIVPNSI
jgi:hypothetical protein